MSKVHVIYSGRRGGGLNDTVKLINDLKIAGITEVALFANRKNLALIKSACERLVGTRPHGRGILGAYLRLAAHVFRRDPIDVVFPMPSYRDLLYILLAARSRCINVISVVHNPPDFTSHARFINRAVDALIHRIVFRHSHTILFLSAAVQRQYEAAQPFHHPSFLTVPYHQYFPVTPAPSAPAERDIDFLVFGRNLPYKNSDVAYRALTELESTGVRFNAVFAGPGYRQSSTAQIEVKDVWIGDEEAMALHARSKYAVLYYSEVSQSGPALLALACGCNLICSNVPFFAELDAAYTGVSVCRTLQEVRSQMLKALIDRFTPAQMLAGKTAQAPLRECLKSAARKK